MRSPQSKSRNPAVELGTEYECLLSVPLSSKCSPLTPLLSLCLAPYKGGERLQYRCLKHQLKTLLLQSATSLLVQFERALTEVRLRCSDNLLMRVSPGSSHTLTLQPASLLPIFTLGYIENKAIIMLSFLVFFQKH